MTILLSLISKKEGLLPDECPKDGERSRDPPDVHHTVIG